MSSAANHFDIGNKPGNARNRGEDKMANAQTTATTEARPAAGDKWTKDSATVLIICILGWAFDVYEQTIMQVVTPILIKEWGITPATMGNVTTISRWLGLVGTLVFPMLADLYGRKPMLILSILGYSLFTGLTGFATGWVTLLIFTSINRVALSGELPIGMVMVSETAPTKWRATALGGLVGGYPFGYMLCTLLAGVVVPLWGWQSLYFIGVLPALLVLWIRIGVKESPRYERVSTVQIKEGLKKSFDIFAPARKYPREMVIGSSIYALYLFAWIGWSAWMPHFLATEKKLGFQVAVSWLSIWMFVAIFAYWICGWLCDLWGRRYVIPAFVIPASILLVWIGRIEDHTTLFWVGLAANFLITGSFGSGLGYTTEIFPTEIRATAVGTAYTFGSAFGALGPAIMGWIATAHSIAAGLPVLALAFFLIAPLFYFFAPNTSRKELTDFVGQKI
jgi:MFS family permease